MQDQLVRVSSVNGQRALQHSGQQVLNSPQSSLKEPYGYTLGWPHWRWKIFRSLEDQEKRDLVGKTGTKAQCPHHMIAGGGLWHTGRMESWTDIFPGVQSKSSDWVTGKDTPNTTGQMDTPNQENKLVRSFQKWLCFYRSYSWSDRFLVAALPLLQVSKSQQYRQGQADRGQSLWKHTESIYVPIVAP